jgi:ribosomal protein S18 acetylase RimI-like enzyme
MSIRSALPSDSQAIAELHAASWQSAYRGVLSEEYLAGDIVADRNTLWMTRLSNPPTNQYVVMSDIDGVLTGFGCAYLGEDREWGSLLDNIHVRPDAHRRGLGSARLRAVAIQCSLVTETMGLYLSVFQDNTYAQNFYKHHGARNVGTDLWHAPGGTEVPRFRFAWSATRLPTRP